jgi:phosphatidylserine decarboxylase
LAPKGWFSEVVGWGARRRVPRSIRRPLYGAFGRVSGARLEEAELPLDEYPSFGSFFARKLRAGSRPLPKDPDAVIAPCDGALAANGLAIDGRLIQAKGKDYSLAELLVDRELAATLCGGSYVTYYLSPKDYHRVHAPLAGRVLGYDYVPGTLFPVNPLIADDIDDLFVRNERVVLHLDTGIGRVAVVLVGATGVGNVELSYGPQKVWSRRFRGMGRISARHATPIPVERGAELGAFLLGSTVIVVTGPGTIELDERLAPGASIRFGQTVARARAGDLAAAPRAGGSSQ